MPTVEQVRQGATVSVVLKEDQPTGRQVQGFVAELLTRGNHPRGIKVRLSDGRVGRVQRLATEQEASSGTSKEQLGRNGEALYLGNGIAKLSVVDDGLGVNGDRVGRARMQYQDFRTDGHDYESRADAESVPNLMDYVRVKPSKQRRNRGGGSVAGAVDSTTSQTGKELGGREFGAVEEDGYVSSDNEYPQASAHRRRRSKRKEVMKLPTYGEEPSGEEAVAKQATQSERGEATRRGSASFHSAKSVCPVCQAFEGDEGAVAHHVAQHFD